MESGVRERRAGPRLTLPRWLTEPSTGAGPRAKLAIAILIALISVASSLAAWRSDVAVQDRDAFELRAEFQSVERRGAEAAIDVNLADSRLTLARLRTVQRRAQALERASRATSDPVTARRLAARAAGYRAIAATVRRRVLPDLFPGGDDGVVPDFAGARRLALLSAESTRDLDPGPETLQARRRDERATEWRWLSLALLGAALCFTAAEVSRSRAYLAFLALGVLALLATAVWAGGIELIT